MQFNSFIFILLFLPVTVFLYFIANRSGGGRGGKFVLIGAGIVFYAYADITLFTTLGISLVLNFAFSLLLQKIKRSSFLFAAPILINIGLLLYFKYTNFFISVADQYAGLHWAPKELALPLGISFFTFQQIAWLVAVRRGQIERTSLLDYLAYILYFPKILMGPLMDPLDFLRQINAKTKKKIDWDNIACGIQIFSLGLFKKVMIADVFAKGVTWAFSHTGTATGLDWLLVMLFYTFEIYFDFSGYCDMAVGASQMLNITLPMNFDSPYQALSVKDFWKRWHISLTQFFTQYVYIPLGGNRKGAVRTYVNIIIVFLLSGLWHGANYTFILWGALHGLFMCGDRLLDKWEQKFPQHLRWLATFSIVNGLWLLFRAESVGQWKHIIKIILEMKNPSISDGLLSCFLLPEIPFLVDVFHLGFTNGHKGFWTLAYLLIALELCLLPGNNYRSRYTLSVRTLIFAVIAFIWGLISLSGESQFVYFNF